MLPANRKKSFPFQGGLPTSNDLMRIRMLYQKQGQEAEWNAYITSLRNSNKSLRALKEELDKREL